MVFASESRDGPGYTPPDSGRGFVSEEEAPHTQGCGGCCDGEVYAPKFAAACDYDGPKGDVILIYQAS